MLCTAEPKLSDDGIAVAMSRSSCLANVVAELQATLRNDDLALLIVYFGADRDEHELAARLADAFPDVPVTGCSTAGEMTPEGFAEDTVIAVGLRKDSFIAVTRCLTGLSSVSMGTTRQIANDAVRKVQELRQRGSDGVGGRAQTFALLLTDGVSHLEEQLVSSLSGSLLNIPLIGGSAGDGLRFETTKVIHDGKAHSDAAVLTVITSRFPLMTFSFSHFSPTPVKLVVTSADVDRRIVKELNGAPAASEYAAALGLDGAPLSPKSFAAHPVAVRVGGGYYIRSIQQVNPDGSLSFLCAVDEGIVFSVARANDIISSAEQTFRKVRSTIGTPRLVLGFECVLRRVEAELQQADRKLSDIYRRNNVVGFHTYGEQYKTLHLNQTFSGIAIGR